MLKIGDVLTPSQYLVSCGFLMLFFQTAFIVASRTNYVSAKWVSFFLDRVDEDDFGQFVVE